MANSFTTAEIISYAKDQDVSFVRLAFCDIFGQLKNISVSLSTLERAFSEGVRFDASQIRGFLNVEDSDLLLFPDPTTMTFLPWRPSQGRVIRFYCDIKHPDGRPFVGDTRESSLKRTMSSILALSLNFIYLKQMKMVTQPMSQWIELATLI